MPLWLSREDVQAVLTMADAIDAVERAFALLSVGDCELPLRTNMAVPPHGGSLLTMPAYLGGALDGLGVKLITLYAQNPSERNLPAIQGIFALFSAQDGSLLALMEAGRMTAVRTGAAGGVAVRHLSRPESRRLALFGSGAQAPFQLEAVLCERPIEAVRVLSRTPENSQRFSDEMSERFSLPVEPTNDVRSAIEWADIVVTATSAHDPLFDGRWLKPGTHINGIGSHLPDAREVDTETIRAARVFTDQTSAALSEAGDLILPIQSETYRPEEICGELGSVISGAIPGRTSPDQITFFKSVGLAVQDVAVASLIYAKAKSRGLGLRLPNLISS